MRDDHLSGLGHELRRSAAAILGSARAMERPDTTTSAVQRERALARIVHQATQLQRLAGNVLAATGQPDPGSCTAAAPVVRDVVAEVASFPMPRRVRANLDEELHVAAGDAALRLIVGNLLTNALRFAAPGSRVTVDTYADGADGALRVHNVGPAIPAEAMDRIFEPFVSGVTPGDPEPGFGYGLYVVRSLTRAHGGRVTATAGNDGVTFMLRLPAAVPQPAQPPAGIRTAVPQ